MSTPTRSFGYHCSRTARRFQQHLLQEVKALGYDFSIEFWPTLRLLAQHEMPVQQAAIADILMRDKATVARLLSRMERQGLLMRSVDPQDQRQKCVRITSAGEAVLQQVAPIVESLYQQALAAIEPSKIENCLDVLEAVYSNLSPTPSPHLAFNA